MKKQTTQPFGNILKEPGAKADLFHYRERVERIDIEQTRRLLGNE